MVVVITYLLIHAMIEVNPYNQKRTQWPLLLKKLNRDCLGANWLFDIRGKQKQYTVNTKASDFLATQWARALVAMVLIQFIWINPVSLRDGYNLTSPITW